MWQIDFSGYIMALRGVLSVARVQDRKLDNLNSHEDENYMYIHDCIFQIKRYLELT